MARKRRIGKNWYIIYKDPYVDPDTGEQYLKETSWALGPITEDEAEDRLRKFRASRGGSIATTQRPQRTPAPRSTATRRGGAPEPRSKNPRLAVAAFIRFERSRGLRPATVRQELDTLKTLLAAWEGVPVQDWSKQRYRTYLTAVKPGLGGKNPKPWSHRTKEIHLGVAKRWLEFLEDEGGFEIPDFVGRLRPGMIRVVQMHEQPEDPPYPVDDLVRVVEAAWALVDERKASLQRRPTPDKERVVRSSVSKALAVSQASLAALALGDLRAVERSDYRLRGPGHATLSIYRRRTGTAIDIPIVGWLRDLLLEHAPEHGPVCANLPQSDSSLNKGLKTIFRRAGVEPGCLRRLRHSFASMVRSVSSHGGHKDGDYAAYGRLMGHKHGSPMCLPEDLRNQSQRVIGLRYDHPDFERCLNLVERLERMLEEVTAAQGRGCGRPDGVGSAAS